MVTLIALCADTRHSAAVLSVVRWSDLPEPNCIVGRQIGVSYDLKPIDLQGSLLATVLPDPAAPPAPPAACASCLMLSDLVNPNSPPTDHSICCVLYQRPPDYHWPAFEIRLISGMKDLRDFADFHNIFF